MISTGALDKTTSERFVANLGDTIVDEVSDSCDILTDMKNRVESALAPLRSYFRNAGKKIA